MKSKDSILVMGNEEILLVSGIESEDDLWDILEHTLKPDTLDDLSDMYCEGKFGIELEPEEIKEAWARELSFREVTIEQLIEELAKDK